ncbi:hypothetical protein M0Q28_05385 [Patescibacteria group bacterium]|jgi:uncharacterized membrane protein|nr:hypothetical protein [Patescibacteria group bacterium]
MTEPLQTAAVPAFDKKDAEDNRWMAALSYLGILCLIPLLAKKDSKFVQEHAKQGLVLLFVEIMFAILSNGGVPVLDVLGQLGSAAAFIASIAGLVHVFKGAFWEIPFLGALRKKINF